MHNLPLSSLEVDDAVPANQAMTADDRANTSNRKVL